MARAGAKNGGCEALRLYKACWCNSAATTGQTAPVETVDIQHPKTVQECTCNYCLMTSRNQVNCDSFCDPGGLLSPRLSADPGMTPFCYTSFSLKKPRITSMLPIGFWSSGTALVGSDVCMHVHAHISSYTHRTHLYLKGNLNHFC